MVKPVYLVLGAIPVIAAILLVTPLLLKNEIPTSAANYTDHLEIEYTKHQLKKISYGVKERVGVQKELEQKKLKFFTSKMMVS